MFQSTKAYSSFSAGDVKTAKEFYGKVLGLNISEHTEMDGLLNLKLDDNKMIMIYSKPDHVPANYTVLNFPVTNIEETINDLNKKGIKFEQYEGDIQTNEKGIFSTEGWAVAWFKDPAGIFCLLLKKVKNVPILR